MNPCVKQNETQVNNCSLQFSPLRKETLFPTTHQDNKIASVAAYAYTYSWNDMVLK